MTLNNLLNRYRRFGGTSCFTLILQVYPEFEAARPSETLLKIYHTTRRHIMEGTKLRFMRYLVGHLKISWLSIHLVCKCSSYQVSYIDDDKVISRLTGIYPGATEVGFQIL
jgi:hypothetical protein